MAPNFIAKENVIRGVECETLQKEINDRTLIRTDFVLQNVYCHLLKNASEFKALSPANIKEEELIQDFKLILDEFMFSHGEKIRLLCAPLDLNIEQIGSEITAVYNELFANGYDWSGIVAFFVFVAVFTQCFIENHIFGDVVSIMYECFCCLIKEKLKPWVDHHGGWGGVRCLKRKERPVGWTKNLFRSTASVIGTLTHFSSLP